MSKYLWVEEYAPQTVADCILPQTVKQTFLHYVKDGQFPNLILAGPAGSGKTSLARALCNDVGADFLFINASLDRGIGDVRTTVAQFASCTSLTGGNKVVFLDEADNLTQDSQKPSARSSKNSKTTVVSSSPATTRTTSSKRSTRGVTSLTSASDVKTPRSKS